MIGNTWDIILKEEYDKEYFKKLIEEVNKLYLEKEIYPPKDKLFQALKDTPYNKVKVVILGQDPYHGVNEANGLSFSVNEGIKMPPSLRNIYKELESDLMIKKSCTDLSSWSMQGVLLLNSILTVEKDKPASHHNLGWTLFTDSIISKINESDTPVVFILWGNYAKSKINLITNKKHLIISSAHPSPFSARNGFFGSKPFSRTNEFLKNNNIKEIEW